MNEKHRLRYMTINSSDRRWGLVVNSVGYQLKEAGDDHPVGVHPSDYTFSPSEGRVLNSFQIHQFLSEGEGVFRSAATGADHEIILREGDMFLLFPGVWHTYFPKGNCVWNEFWIGFEGKIPAEWQEKGLISPESPIMKVGIREDVSRLFKAAIDLAMTQKPGYQLLLGGITHNILCSAIYRDKNRGRSESGADHIITRAKITVDQQISTINPESLASQLGVGYSRFRKMFKDYTGFSPGQYIAEMRILNAKELLRSTNLTIKEIALTVGYEDYDYFATAFRRRAGKSPSEYRESALLKAAP